MNEPFQHPLLARRGTRCLLWALAAVMAGVIFLFSSQDGNISAGLSDIPARWLISIFSPEYFSQSAAVQKAVYHAAQLVVRKAAHFSEFALMGLLIALLLESYHRPHAWGLGWLLTTAYAATDELHQKLVSGRTAAVMDVTIDSLGALAGAGLAVLIVLLACRRRYRNSKRDTAT